MGGGANNRRNKRGVRIIANSYGCSVAKVNYCYSVQFQKAITAFRDQGGLFIVSAGNDGTNNDKVSGQSLSIKCTHAGTCVGLYEHA